jgi:DNA repair protein RecO (recombination protein O)
LYQQLDCIALRTIRYSDRNAILTAYTRQAGRLSFLLPSGTGKVAARLRALLMPLGRFECVADIRPGRDIHPIRDVRGIIFPPVADPLRSTIALFISDMLTSLLREQMSDPLLFDFIDDALRRLSPDLRGLTLHGTALLNFHICFLIRMTRFLGIEPDWATFSDGSLLDMADGIFRRLPPSHRKFLPEGESAAAYKLSRINFRNAHLYHLTRFERNLILDRILLYYQIHYPSVSEPTSLAILRMLAD